MTPDDWAGAHDPLEMLDHLRGPPGHYSHRRLVIHRDLLSGYAARCLLGIGAGREADLFESYACGGLHLTDPDADLRALEVRAGRRAGGGYTAGHGPRSIPADAQRARAALAALRALTGYDGSEWWAAVAVTRETQYLLQREQCGWLRCLFPNPLRGFTVAPDWLTSTVVGLVRGIDAERAFDRLPILADALEDAGSDSTDLLRHCRHDTVHDASCWAVDALREASGID